ncbi:hypothetical protein ACFSQP_07505 [Bizionia sediminis]|uniref:Uncharacterized protein n=1 Tax=Bizionia sediminis TaxID=1737064 RepID=A0ABW5KRM9_9FLAO
MQKFYYLLLLFVAATVTNQAQTMPTTSWADYADTSWYDANQNNFTISSAEALAGVAQLVAAGNNFAGKTITLNNNINLEAHLWVPIGVNIDFPFSGTFNGGSFTISNLFINSSGSFVGLFGQAENANISQIKINTATINAMDTAGVLVGNLSTNSSLEDCHVTNGLITGLDYNIGGLVGVY